MAELLSKRKRAASRWDHSHLTRRLATLEDAEEHRKLPPEKRHILLRAARFSAHYYSVATLPVLALAMAIRIPTTLKVADSLGIPLTCNSSTVAIVLLLTVFGILDLFSASKQAAHAQTWVAAFNDVERELDSMKSRRSWWQRRPL